MMTRAGNSKDDLLIYLLFAQTWMIIQDTTTLSLLKKLLGSAQAGITGYTPYEN